MATSSYTIPEAAAKMGYTPKYIRSLIRTGQLATRFVPVVPDSLVKRHLISAEEIERYMAGGSRKTHRADGRNKFIVYLNASELKVVQKLLKDNNLKDVAATIRPANNLKAYRKE